MYILAIESSCDETAAAVSKDGREILSNIVATQIAEHRLYGGVVPEIASRRHTENINAVVKETMKKSRLSLSDIDAIAVTYAPGLIGALLVGTSFAKGLSMATGKPLVPVHHIAGHIASNYIAHKDLKPPYLCLVASGGHSHIVEILDYTKFRVVGRTRDDAAGECFDKVGRVIGFPYPAGKFIDDAAKNGDANFYKLPKPVVNGSVYDFSFSGLKTAVINMAHNAEQKGESLHRDNMAASFQKTVAEILTEKTIHAAKDLGYKTIALAGGVSANSGVRQKLSEECEKNGFSLYMPPLSLCGDNAVMIACQSYYDFLAGKRADESLNAIATLSLENI